MTTDILDTLLGPEDGTSPDRVKQFVYVSHHDTKHLLEALHTWREMQRSGVTYWGCTGCTAERNYPPEDTDG